MFYYEAFYGALQAGEIWGLLIHRTLRSRNFYQFSRDPWLYILEQEPKYPIFAFIVDDVAFAPNDQQLIEKFKLQLRDSWWNSWEGCQISLAGNLNTRLNAFMFFSQNTSNICCSTLSWYMSFLCLLPLFCQMNSIFLHQMSYHYCLIISTATAPWSELFLICHFAPVRIYHLRYPFCQGSGTIHQCVTYPLAERLIDTLQLPIDKLFFPSSRAPMNAYVDSDWVC